MKTWDSIESLAQDMGINIRTGWRWLRDGKVKKRREDGNTVFVLVEEPTDILTTDTDNGVSSDTSVDVSDSEIVSKPIRFSKKVPISKPSPELIRERENTERLELKVKQAEAQNKLDKVTENKRREREKLEEMEKRRKWMNYGLKLFEHEVDLETKLRIKKAVSMILDDVGVDGDPDELKFLITENISDLHEEYNRLYVYPQLKEELISKAVQNVHIPIYLGKDTARRIKADIRKALEESFTGEEEAAEYFADTEAMGKELIDAEKELFFKRAIR